jgi:hypothetical protein
MAKYVSELEYERCFSFTGRKKKPRNDRTMLK